VPRGRRRGPVEPEHPCDPNPCTTSPGLTVCTEVGDGFECSCNEFHEPDGDGGCAEIREVTTGTVTDAVDWEEPEPTYLARLRIVDGDDTPIEGALVVREGLAWAADEKGEIRLGDIPAKEAVSYEIRADGYATSFVRVRFYEAGLGVQEIRLKEVDLEVSVPSDESTTISDGAVSVAFPAGAFRGPNLQPYEGVAQVRITSVDPHSESVRLGPELMASAEQGNATPITTGGMVFVQITDEEGRKLPLVRNEAVGLTFVLPANMDVEDGQELQLRFFNDETGLWQAEGGCLAEPIPEEDRTDDRTFRCTGLVKHFTWWNVDAPEDTACVNISAALDLGVQYQVLESHFQLDTCTVTVEGEGDDAVRSVTCAGEYMDSRQSYYREGRYHYPVVVLPPDGDRPESICRLVSVENRDLVYVVRGFFQLEDQNAADPAATRTWYRYVTEEMTFDSIAERLGSEDLWAFTAQPSSLCPFDTRCRQVALELELADLIAIPMLDEDDDGYGAIEPGHLPWKVARHYLNMPADCDDTDPDIHPGAEDAPCDLVDSDCSPRTEIPPLADGSKPTWEDVPARWRSWSGADAWNRYWCRTPCVERAEREVPGNLFDEDCDGRTIDADGDNWITNQDAQVLIANDDALTTVEDLTQALGFEVGDCDDFHDGTNPDQVEVPHNWRDEDCDGEALDEDGDQFYDIRHRELIRALDLVEDGFDGPWDCEDTQSAVNPDADPALEAAFRQFYFQDDEDRWHRSINFCHYVDTRRGELFDHANSLLMDYNCDGFVTDIDGDGWTRPGNTVLGADKARDCDDLDFRIHPTDADPDTCGAAYPIADIVNDALCEFADDNYQNEPDAPVIPQCPNTPGGLLTGCQQLVDAEGEPVEEWACTFRGLRGSTPPRLPEDAGRIWGVCSSTTRLPVCVAGTRCAGPVNPADSYIADLNRLYIDPVRECVQENCEEDAEGNPIEGTCEERCHPSYLEPEVRYGLCFPRCDRCTGVVCDETANPCTRAECEGETGACVEVPVNGRACDDGNDCTLWDACGNSQCRTGQSAPLGTPCEGGTGSCDGQGSCQVDQCLDVVCQQDGNECTRAVCNSETGECGPENLDEGACATNTPCRVGQCNAGQCEDTWDPALDGQGCGDGMVCDAQGDCVQG